jgi:hypothetical protein
MTKKANNTTAFLRRNLASCPVDVKSTCYKTLVRPQLEYAATVWGPWTQTNISKIEEVQRRAARFTLDDYRRTSSVSSMLHQQVGRPHHPSTTIQSHHVIPSYPSTGRNTISTLFTTNRCKNKRK